MVPWPTFGVCQLKEITVWILVRVKDGELSNLEPRPESDFAMLQDPPVRGMAHGAPFGVKAEVYCMSSQITQVSVQLQPCFN